jgi:hypothetical protein
MSMSPRLFSTLIAIKLINILFLNNKPLILANHLIQPV